MGKWAMQIKDINGNIHKTNSEELPEFDNIKSIFVRLADVYTYIPMTSIVSVTYWKKD